MSEAIFNKETDTLDLEWKNEHVSNYYENIPIEVLRGFAIKGGFEDGCDINLAYPYISHTNSVIEAGAAYGRVIKHLLNKGYTGKIYAIERSKQFCEYLNANFSNQAEIINADIQSYHPAQKVDAILWMWSNITEFPKLSQLPILRHLVSWLNPNGILIMETILHTLIPQNVTTSHGQSYIVDSEYGKAYGYTPSKEEVHSYAEALEFKHIKHIDYQTTTSRKRILHIFSNNPI